MKHGWIIIVIAIILSFGAGIMIPRAMSNGQTGISVDKELLLESIKEQFKVELVNRLALLEQDTRAQSIVADTDVNTTDDTSVISDTQTNAVSETSIATNNTDNTLITEDTTVANEDIITTDDSIDSNASESAVVANLGDDTPDTIDFIDTKGTPLGTETTTPVTGEKIVKDTWVQSQIDANRGQISDADLYTGASIYNSLDTGYLFSFSEGGITDEEKVEINNYLKSNLSPAQYQIALDLFYKYAHLVN